MKNHSIKLFLAGVMLIFSPTLTAGVYTDDLSRCLVAQTTQNEKIVLVKWMFTAMALHPAVNSLSNISARQRDNSNREVAQLFEKLLTRTCKDPARKAVKYEGSSAIESSFGVLGQVAAKELFSNPRVSAGLSDLDKHIDSDKLNKTLGL